MSDLQGPSSRRLCLSLIPAGWLKKHCQWGWLLLLPLFLAGCSFNTHGFLAPAGPIAETQRNHFFSIITWTMIVIVPLFVATPLVLWKYRLGKKNAVYSPKWDSSWILELLIWGLPVMVVIILGWNLWNLSHQLDPYRPIASDKSPLKVKVVGMDWKWLFIYPEQKVASADKLVLPKNRPISFQLTSATVMQSFFIPRLGSQVYTMPGMVTSLHLLAAKPGQYKGMNTQYTGRGFAAQQFMVHAVSQGEFDQWIADLRTKPPLEEHRYKELSARSILAKPKGFGHVPQGLFQHIVTTGQSIPSIQQHNAMPSSQRGQDQEEKRLQQQRQQYQQQTSRESEE